MLQVYKRLKRSRTEARSKPQANAQTPSTGLEKKKEKKPWTPLCCCWLRPGAGADERQILGQSGTVSTLFYTAYSRCSERKIPWLRCYDEGRESRVKVGSVQDRHRLFRSVRGDARTLTPIFFFHSIDALQRLVNFASKFAKLPRLVHAAAVAYLNLNSTIRQNFQGGRRSWSGLFRGHSVESFHLW